MVCTSKKYEGFNCRVGSKAQVWHGNAHHTSGGLQQVDLMQNKRGRIVSEKQHEAGVRAYENMKPHVKQAFIEQQKQAVSHWRLSLCLYSP